MQLDRCTSFKFSSSPLIVPTMALSVAVLSVAVLFCITILLTQLWISLTFRIWVMGWCVDLTTKSTNPGTKMRSHSSIELYSFYVNEIV